MCKAKQHVKISMILCCEKLRTYLVQTPGTDAEPVIEHLSINATPFGSVDYPWPLRNVRHNFFFTQASLASSNRLCNYPDHSRPDVLVEQLILPEPGGFTRSPAGQLDGGLKHAKQQGKR